jgi:hypothetical protein
MIRALILLVLTVSPAAAQTYIATEAGKPCPPMSTPVKLQDGRWVCAVTATLTPLENSMPKDSK